MSVYWENTDIPWFTLADSLIRQWSKFLEGNLIILTLICLYPACQVCPRWCGQTDQKENQRWECE